LVNGPGGPELAKSLKSRGISSADELLLLRLAVLAQKLHAKIAAGYHGSVSAAQIVRYYRTHADQLQGLGEPQLTLAAATPKIRQILLQAGAQKQVSAFIAAYRKRWKERTSCQPGYVIAECRNGP
jgi:hypothetical protein